MANRTMRGYNFHWYSFQGTLKEKGYKRIWKTACDFSQTSGKILLFWLFPETALILHPEISSFVLCTAPSTQLLYNNQRQCWVQHHWNGLSKRLCQRFTACLAKSIPPTGICPLPAAVALAHQCAQWCHKAHRGSYYFCWYCDPTTDFSSAKFPCLKTALSLK